MMVPCEVQVRIRSRVSRAPPNMDHKQSHIYMKPHAMKPGSLGRTLGSRRQVQMAFHVFLS